MAKATASPPARRRSGDRPRGKAKTPKHKTKETSPPKHESAWKHEINRGFIAPFLLTRSVHFLAAIWHNLSPPLTRGARQHHRRPPRRALRPRSHNPDHELDHGGLRTLLRAHRILPK